MQIVRCNMCYWSGPETNIPLTSEDKEYCPHCGSVGCLMDIDDTDIDY